MSRRLLRRQQTIEEALDAAVAIMEELGVGGLSMSEIAHRVGMRQPSLYKYFPSLHAVYDALFARGLELNGAAMSAAIEGASHGVPAIRASGQALVRWAVENPALAQLLYWRPVPGFAPTAATFDVSERQMDQLRAAFAASARAGQLRPSAASDEAPRLFTIVLSGLISQQMANEPAADYDTGSFTGLTDAAFDMFFARYAPNGELTQTPAHDQPARDLLRRRGKTQQQRAARPGSRGGSIIDHSPVPENFEPRELLLRTAGTCEIEQEHPLQVFGEQRERFAAVLRGFGADDWAAPTRCADWSAHDVVRHLCDASTLVSGTSPGDRRLDVTAGFDPRVTPRRWAAVPADGGGIFDVESRCAATLTVTRMVTAGPPAAQVADALAGRSTDPAVLSGLSAGSSTALLRMADFFNSPVEQSPA